MAGGNGNSVFFGLNKFGASYCLFRKALSTTYRIRIPIYKIKACTCNNSNVVSSVHSSKFPLGNEFIIVLYYYVLF